MSLRDFLVRISLDSRVIVMTAFLLGAPTCEVNARKAEPDPTKVLKIRVPVFDIEKFREGRKVLEDPIEDNRRRPTRESDVLPDITPFTHDDYWNNRGEDGAPPNAFLDVDAKFSASSDLVRSQLDLAMDRLISKYTKSEREAFLKLPARNKKGFDPNKDGGGCWISRVYNTTTETTELKLTHPSYIKMISRTLLKSVCSEKDNLPAGASEALLALGSSPGSTGSGDALLKSRFRPGPGVSPLVQLASLSFGLGLQESKGNVLAGYHASEGVQTMEAGPFQNSGTGLYAAGFYEREGAKIMESLAADYQSRMMKIVDDKQRVHGAGYSPDNDFATRQRAGLALAAAHVTRDPALEFDKLCGVKDFNDKSYWYQEDYDGVQGDKKEDVSNRAILNAWRKDIRSTRGKEVRDPDEELQVKMRRIVKGEADQSGSTLTYAELAFEEMQKASQAAKAAFARLADPNDKFIVTELYLAGSTSPNEKDPKEGLKLAKALRTMNLFCPKFASEMSALMLRYNGGHYGPVTRPEAVPGCRNYFAQLEKDFRSMVGKAPSESKYCRAALGEEFR